MSLANCLIYTVDRFISYSNDEYTVFVCIYITLISPFNFPKYVCAQKHNKICAQALCLDLLDLEASTSSRLPHPAQFLFWLFRTQKYLTLPFFKSLRETNGSCNATSTLSFPHHLSLELISFMCMHTSVLEHDLVQQNEPYVTVNTLSCYSIKLSHIKSPCGSI